MSVFSILGSGAKGMAASQLGAGASAQNTSNVAAAGYTRRSLVPDGATGGFSMRRVVDPFLERRVLGATSTSGEATAERLSLGPLDRIFSEVDGGLGNALDAFQVSLQDLASRPSDGTARAVVLSTARSLAQAFRGAASELSAARADTDARIEAAVKSVNGKLHQIAALGAEIGRAEVGGREASDLRDRRDALVREVAQQIPVTELINDQGGFTLTLAGSQPLVSPDGKVSELSTVRRLAGDVVIHKQAAGASVDVTPLVSSGAVFGYLKARDGALSNARSQLDQLAFDMAAAYNTAHDVGVGLDGGTGRKLFDAPLTLEGAASNLRLSTVVEGNPDYIGAALDAASLPSDNRGALSLAAVSYAPLAVSGMTVSEALASLLGSSGAALSAASANESFADGALSQVQALHESVSGVSSDEEMVAMIQYQRAYEASIKVVQVADEMLQQLLQLKR